MLLASKFGNPVTRRVAGTSHTCCKRWYDEQGVLSSVELMYAGDAMLSDTQKPNNLQKLPSIHNVPSSHVSFLITASKGQ